MSKVSGHPSVIKFKERNFLNKNKVPNEKLDADWLRSLSFSAGADDVGFVEVGRREIVNEREEVRSLLPKAKAIIAFACKINRDNIRTPSRSVANTEFHQSEDKLLMTARKIVSALNKKNVRAVSVSGLFPMEMDRWPGKIWDISLKPLAIAAGLGQMGKHRMMIHPKFGAFIYLSAILIDREVTTYDKPTEYNPCLECKLCSATCPTGAVASDGNFDFFSCVTHNYREKLGGFSNWTENIAKSNTSKSYRHKVSDSETVSMWQSLTTGGSTKCDQCMAVCPAGDEVLGQFITDRKSYIKDVVKPLQQKNEKVYVIAASDAEDYVKRRFPHKQARTIGNGLRAATIKGFLAVLPQIFQRGQSEGLDAIYHFAFTGSENMKATVVIKEKKN